MVRLHNVVRGGYVIEIVLRDCRLQVIIVSERISWNTFMKHSDRLNQSPLPLLRLVIAGFGNPAPFAIRLCD
ncbi:hypothetical protein CGZ80_11130 [Rhodopirellula sp. MGV]|nr:hypothetical protein CGZ80_11130 [Rhodopirellula sp. MGV]